MATEQRDNPVDLGIFGRRRRSGLGISEMVAAGLSVVWLIACVVFFVVLGAAAPGAPDALRFVMVLLAIVLPVAVIWLAASASRSARIMREESARLQTALNTMRQSFVEAQHAHVLGGRPIDLTRKLEEIAEKQRQTESALATFVSARARSEPQAQLPPPAASAQAPAADEAGQAQLALETDDGPPPPVAIEDLIRAINFPESADDSEGFASLRRALADRRIAVLIQAAQDVLTLLSQDGIYMDDLHPDQARPDVWRRFARGERGRTIAALGGIRDRSSLALSAGRMRHDTVFRDAAHHFLRKFDEVISAIEPDLDDTALAALATTRTARAFMLLGRVAGTFD